MNHKQIQAVLFDLDGVLIDSEKIYNQCWVRAAQQQGFIMTREQALLLRSLDRQLAQQLFNQWYSDERAYNVIRTTRKQLMKEFLATHPLSLKPGVHRILPYLKKLHFKLAIVTASNFEEVTKYIKDMGISHYFDHVISTKSVVRGKPFPDVYLYACSKLNINPSACIALEDSPNGVQSAHAAGCYTVMIPDLSPYSPNLKSYVDVWYQNLEEFLTQGIMTKARSNADK